jgi:hypothetical protein
MFIIYPFSFTTDKVDSVISLLMLYQVLIVWMARYCMVDGCAWGTLIFFAAIGKMAFPIE